MLINHFILPPYFSLHSYCLRVNFPLPHIAIPVLLYHYLAVPATAWLFKTYFPEILIAHILCAKPGLRVKKYFRSTDLYGIIFFTNVGYVLQILSNERYDKTDILGNILTLPEEEFYNDETKNTAQKEGHE